MILLKITTFKLTKWNRASIKIRTPRIPIMILPTIRQGQTWVITKLQATQMEEIHPYRERPRPIFKERMTWIKKGHAAEQDIAKAAIILQCWAQALILVRSVANLEITSRQKTTVYAQLSKRAICQVSLSSIKRKEEPPRNNPLWTKDHH